MTTKTPFPFLPLSHHQCARPTHLVHSRNGQEMVCHHQGRPAWGASWHLRQLVSVAVVVFPRKPIELLTLSFICIRPQVAEQVKPDNGSIFQGFESLQEAQSVYERARQRAIAAGMVWGGPVLAEMDYGVPLPPLVPPHDIFANGHGNGDTNRTGRARSGAGNGGGVTQIYSTIAPSHNNTTLNGSGDRTITRAYPSPSPSSQGTCRGGTSTGNHRHHSRGRSISLSLSTLLDDDRRGILVLPSSLVSLNRDRDRTRAPSNATSPCPVTPSRGDARLRKLVSSSAAAKPPTGSVRVPPKESTSNRTRVAGANTTPNRSNSVRTMRVPMDSDSDSYVTAKSRRTLNWVVEMSVSLPDMPESALTQTPRARAGARGAHLTPTLATPGAVDGSGTSQRSPPVLSPRATVDTSYAISISSSSDSSSSPISSDEAQKRTLLRNLRSPRTVPLPPSISEVPTPAQNGHEIWVDRGHFTSRSPLASWYATPSSSPPTESETQMRELSEAGSMPQPASGRASAFNTAPCSPLVAGGERVERGLSGLTKVELARSPFVHSTSHETVPSTPGSPGISPPRTPARSSWTTPRAQPTEQRNSATPGYWTGLICQCISPCDSCRSKRVPQTLSNSMNETDFTEQPHAVRVVVDPRSPIKRGSTRNSSRLAGL